MNKEIYETAKTKFLNGESLRSIAQQLGIDRKKLSAMLKKDNIYTDKKISGKQIKKAIKDFNDGESLTKIAKKLKVDRHTLSKEFDRRGIDKTNNKHHSKGHTKRKITQYDDYIITEYIDNKKSIQSIAEELKVSTNTVWNCLLARGIVDNNRTSRTYKINNNRFKRIETEEEAYWLGFLMADGYIDEVRGLISLCLQEKDKEHIIKFINFIGSDHKGYYKNSGEHTQYRVDINSREIVDNLVALGCCQAKTFKLRFPSYRKVPKKLQRHFIRGYFDADGCASLHKKILTFSIVSAAEPFISKLQDTLVKELNINRTKISIRQKEGCQPLYTLQNSARKDINKIYNYLYNESTIYLKRKKDKFENYFNQNAVLRQGCEKSQDN